MDNNHASFVPPPIKSLIWFPFKNQGIGFNNGTHVCVLISRIPGPSQALARRYEDILQSTWQAEEMRAVENPENVDDSSPPRHDDTSIPGTSVELRRRAKGKNVEDSRISPIPSPTRSPRTFSTLVSSDTEKLQELKVTHPTPSSGSFVPKLTKTNHLLSLIKAKPNRFKRYKTFFHELQGRYGYLFAHLKKRFMPWTSSDQLADNLLDAMMETLPSLVKEKVTEQVKKEVPVQVRDQVPVYLAKGLILERKMTKEETKRLISKAILQERGMKFEKTQVPHTACRPSAVRTRDQDDPYDDAHLEGGNSAKRQKTSEYEAYLKKKVDELLRQRCTSGDEHHYHIDQMKNFLQSDIVWESRKEILVSPHLRKITPLVQRCQRDPESPALSLINQDLLYLKKGNSGHEKIHFLCPLHKFPAIVFNDDDIEERTPDKIVARRAHDCIVSITEPDYKNLNKNDIEDMYLLIMNNKVPDYANTKLLWSLSVFIRSSVIWERVHDFQLGIKSYQQKINLTTPTITFPGIEEYDVYSIVYEPVHGIIYTNSKKEKRVMSPSKIHKFCDAILRRSLEGLKSYYNDVKYGYVQKELTNDEAEFLKLFEEEIEVRLSYRDQMRRWEMYVNGRPLGLRRERPE
ncbi:hypothetical protein Tco_0366827 [Tanacetum coccineum]